MPQAKELRDTGQISEESVVSAWVRTKSGRVYENELGLLCVRVGSVVCARRAWCRQRKDNTS